MDDDLDGVFKALADSSRRYILDQLRERPGQTLGQLCTYLEMSRQAVSKHLAVLESADLVATVWHGREKRHYLNPMPIDDIHRRWISKYEQSRLEALANLKAALEERHDD